MAETRAHYGQGYGQKNQTQSPVPELKKVISSYTRLEDLPATELVAVADKLGKYLKDIQLKTTQIRRFLDGVRKLDNQFARGKNFDRDMVILLKPRLAYAAGRQNRVKPLMDVLAPAIDRGAASYRSFKKLVALIESIVAYHKFYGGGD
ncbi:type III-A CRISPR-associated protein Csm2 [Thermodesulfovibrio sp. TK110]